jgi:hypothetical protein
MASCSDGSGHTGTGFPHGGQNQNRPETKVECAAADDIKSPEIRKTDRAGEPGRFFSGERREEIKAQLALHLLCHFDPIRSIASLYWKLADNPNNHSGPNARKTYNFLYKNGPASKISQPTPKNRHLRVMFFIP